MTAYFFAPQKKSKPIKAIYHRPDFRSIELTPQITFDGSEDSDSDIDPPTDNGIWYEV